ncbi:MAG: hypothetical protein ACRDD7_12990 [Peptostreptococcaceae bacterium]
MKVKNEYIEKLKKYFKSLDYENCVEEIKYLRQCVETNNDDIKSKILLSKLELSIKRIHNLCKGLPVDELTIITYRHLRKVNDKHLSIRKLGEILMLAPNTIQRKEIKALNTLTYLKYGEESLVSPYPYDYI